jgi:NAD(P)H-hydrate epimerase
MAENELAIGELHILNIGLHKEFEETEQSLFLLIDKQLIKDIYKPRKKFGHKGTYGHALLVAGSLGKMGAAILSAKACLKSGVGLLTAHIPVIGYEIMQTALPEAMVSTEENIDPKKYTAIGIGPGLGITELAKDLLLQTIKNTTGIGLVIDADALNILSAHQEILNQLPVDCILTPHPKEFERLFGKCENDFERMERALKKATEHNCYIILKGHNSFIATPNGNGYFNSTGNAGMATGGSGDILTGILTGLIAQGYSPEETCLLGVYLHGMAGDIAAEKLSQEAMIASDITDNIGQAFKLIAYSKSLK